VGSASLEVVVFVGVHLGRSFTCLFTPLNKITRGMPLASTTMCRLEPSLPLSRWVGSRFLAPGGLVPRSHQCWPGSNRFGHVHASESAWPGATAPRHRRHSSRAGATSRSCRCHTQEIGEVFPGNACLQHEQDAAEGGSSLTASLRAPPLAEGTKAGMRGCSCRHGSLLTGRRAMRAASVTALRAPLME
jgi:hypothetical protein